MAKICPETNEKVLYAECLECEERGGCNLPGIKKGTLHSIELASKYNNPIRFVVPAKAGEAGTKNRRPPETG